MRLAIVVASSYEKSSRLDRLAVADVDGRRVAERLGEGDARFEVEEIPPSPRLRREIAAAVERARSRRGPSSVLLYFSGYAELDEDGELSLALDARRADRLPLADLGAELGAPDDALVVLDLVHAPDPDDPTLSASCVGAARDALAPKQSGIGLLVAARPADQTGRVPSPLTHLFLRALERVTPSSGGRVAEAVTAAGAYESMRADSELFHELPALGFFRGRRDFPLLLPPSVVVSDAASRSEPPARPSARPPKAAAAEPPTPAGATAAGDALAAEGRHEAAIEAYKRALLLSGSTKGPERAELYFRIGCAKRALGSAAEAVHNFDKALGVEPLHARAFDEAAELLAEQSDFERLERLHRRRYEARTSDDDRVAELDAIATLWTERAGDPRPAARALEQWIALRPDAEAYRRLIAVQDALGRPAAAVASRRKLAELEPSAEARARVLAEAARIASQALPNKQEALELARQALEADAGALSALEVAAVLLAKQRRWMELGELYDSVLERTRDPAVAWDLAKKLGMLFRDELDDAAGAKRAFLRALEADASDVELRYWVGELFEAERDHASAAEHMRQAARHAPRQADIYRRALWLFEKTGERDAAWCAAVALEELGEADINESLLADAHRPEGLPAVRAALDADDWHLLDGDVDAELESLLALLCDAALGLSAPTAAPDAAARQDPEKSTATVSRSLVWTARLLGRELPALYVVSEAGSELATLPDRERAVFVSRSLASGVELPELAFLWGRHLGYHRRERLLLLAYPALADLARLLLAALSVGGLESDAVDDELRALGEQLAEGLSDAALDDLREQAARMQTRGLRQRLVAWTRAVHTRAARAGLVACGDLRDAAAFVRKHPPYGAVEVDEQIDDLRAWSISREHAQVRQRIGVALS